MRPLQTSEIVSFATNVGDFQVKSLLICANILLSRANLTVSLLELKRAADMTAPYGTYSSEQGIELWLGGDDGPATSPGRLAASGITPDFTLP